MNIITINEKQDTCKAVLNDQLVYTTFNENEILTGGVVNWPQSEPLSGDGYVKMKSVYVLPNQLIE